MAAPNITNTDLEQSIFKANLKELRLRRRVVLVALVPIALGALWLIYSLVVVTKWKARAREVEKRAAEIEQRETVARQNVADAHEKRVAAEARAQSAEDKEKAAKARADDVQQKLVKVRDEVGGLGTLLPEISAARSKASQLMASAAVETQLVEIRSSLGRTLGRIEQEIDKSLPASEQKPRVFFFVSDDSQRAAAKALTPILEGAGFDIAAVSRNPGRRIENTEVRYFRDPADRAEATRIQGFVAKQTGQTDCKISHSTDPDTASGSRKFQVWFGKPPPAPPRQ